ncbi:IS200/IS605 family transposase [Methylococcus sp. Mc7]|uniref:IS200/IS605 family transposase n=1 Tax=Methylococcus sp. Mc7 TaxID=2860258 RepID=UPI00351D7652
MKEYQSLSHTRWDCKYHVVFIPKRRKKQLLGVLKRHLGELFHELAGHKDSKIVEGHLMADHVHSRRTGSDAKASESDEPPGRPRAGRSAAG